MNNKYNQIYLIHKNSFGAYIKRVAVNKWVNRVDFSILGSMQLWGSLNPKGGRKENALLPAKLEKRYLTPGLLSTKGEQYLSNKVSFSYI